MFIHILIPRRMSKLIGERAESLEQLFVVNPLITAIRPVFRIKTCGFDCTTQLPNRFRNVP